MSGHAVTPLVDQTRAGRSKHGKPLGGLADCEVAGRATSQLEERIQADLPLVDKVHGATTSDRPLHLAEESGALYTDDDSIVTSGSVEGHPKRTKPVPDRLVVGSPHDPKFNRKLEFKQCSCKVLVAYLLERYIISP